MGERFNLLTGKMIIDPPKKRKKKLPEAIVGDKVDAYLKVLAHTLEESTQLEHLETENGQHHSKEPAYQIDLEFLLVAGP